MSASSRDAITKSLGYFRSAIGGAVIGHDDLRGVIGLLQNTMERLTDVALTIVDRNNATYERRIHGRYFIPI